MGRFLTSIEIGNKIRMLRRHAGFTQEGLAELVGVSFQQIQKYENGSTKMNTDKLQHVANALNVPVSSLFEDDTFEKPPLSDVELKMIQAYRSIQDDSLLDSLTKVLLRIK
jgi:transcriptional regulator with XRE-family HTH domain